MEVTPMSPSPASLTEGDDLCETDVTNVAIHSVALLISLCGLAGNGAVIYLYSMKSRTYAILHLAVADFLILLFMVPSALLLLLEDMSCSPIVPLIYLNFLFQLSVVSCHWGLYQLMHSSFSRDVYKLFQLCCCCDVPLRLLLLVACVQYWAFFALFAVIPTVTFLCLSHEQEHCQAALISMYATILLLFTAPVVLSCILDIIKTKWDSRKQQFKRQHIIVFIIVLLTLLLIFCNFLQQLGYFRVSSEVFFLLTCIHSSIKPFIYFLAGWCWSPCSMGSLWLSLQRVFVERKKKTASSDDAITDTGV